MLIGNDPSPPSADAVRHLCAGKNRFLAPTTFPDVHTLEQYAEDQGKLFGDISAPGTPRTRAFETS